MSLQFGLGVSNSSVKIREAWSCFREHRRGERVGPLVAMASLLLCLGTSTLKGKGARPTRHLAHHIKCCPDKDLFVAIQDHQGPDGNKELIYLRSHRGKAVASVPSPETLVPSVCARVSCVCARGQRMCIQDQVAWLPIKKMESPRASRGSAPCNSFPLLTAPLEEEKTQTPTPVRHPLSH